MSRDYKNNRPAKPKAGGSKSGGGNSIMTGLLLGLVIGIGIAVAAAVYLNKAPNPFANKTSQPASQPDAVAKPTKPAAKEPEILKPQGAQEDRFTFYKDLPGQGEQNGKAAAKVAAPEATPPVTVEAPKGLYLQVGAFQRETDADNLKAKLALMGIDASISTVEVKDKGVLHRLRIGPMSQASDIDRVRAQLKLNNIDSTPVKN